MSIEDRAQEHEAQIWEIHNMRRRPPAPTAGPGEPGYGPEECEDCEAEMPAVRRSYGFRLCTNCASRQERARGRR
jgi:hypothetical protein